MSSSDDETLGVLAAQNWPGATVADGFLHRAWAVRLAEPAAERLVGREGELLDSVVNGVRATAGQPHPIERRPADFAQIQVVAVDQRHVFLRIRLAAGFAQSELGLAANLAALQKLDEIAPVEDLQGTPRRFWRVLLGK
ncbi:MAG TPA: hypothetical protein VKZ18_13600 [Polyangia bacterium]|nr:hypothetical protein [Polyangia bacterium]